MTTISLSPNTKHGNLSDKQLDVLRQGYATASTKQQKLALAKRARILNAQGEPDIRKMYNVACVYGLTRRSEDLTDEEFGKYMRGEIGIAERRKPFSEEQETVLLGLREDPQSTVFSRDDDKYIIAKWRKEPVQAIALARGHSETAVMYRARSLKRRARLSGGRQGKLQPLRKAAHLYELQRVLGWLGLGESEVSVLRELGVEIFDRQTRPGDHSAGPVVVAASLYDFLKKHGPRLITERDADRYFILEILETAPELQQIRERAQLELPVLGAGEGCRYLSHGHTCLNQESGPLFRLYCDGDDKHCPTSTRTMPLIGEQDLTDNWSA